MPLIWADIEATFTPAFIVSPVSGKNVAESDAKYIEPLSTTVTCVALAAWSTLRGAAADGREVVIVSETLTKEAALAL